MISAFADRGRVRRPARRVACLLGALGLIAASVPAAPGADAASTAPSAEEVLDAAFTNRYKIDLVTTIELVMHGRGGQQRKRTIEAVTKVIDGKVNSIGRLVAPEYLRGMTVLMMETEGRGQNAFVYMPSLNRVRRITTAQRGDAFFGSDVTYEDIEQQYVDEFDFDGIEEGELNGEPVYQVHVRPNRRYNYARATFTIAQADSAILQTRYYKRGTDEPYRVIAAPRAHMVDLSGHVLPTRLKVENRMRGTYTDVQLSNLDIERKIPNRIFSVRTLEQKRPLPGER